MVITFAKGKLIVTQHEVQCRITSNAIVMQAAVEDLQCYRQGNVLIADAGSTLWSIALDNAEQLEQVIAETGIEAQ
ncbi:DUF3389 family protein [Shewanella maritima]|uniref:DUF3389 family protein n=1 Tax=Shewanella maritima TaxID=2520507 RepID=UPI00373697EE